MAINSPEDISGCHLWLDTRDTTGCVQTSAGDVTSLANLASSGGPDFHAGAAATRYPNDSGTAPILGEYNGQTCLYVDPDSGGAAFSNTTSDVRAMPRTFVVYAEYPSPQRPGIVRILDTDNWAANGVRLASADEGTPAVFPYKTYLAGTSSNYPYAVDWPADQPFVMFFSIPLGGVDSFIERIDINAGVPATPVTGPNVTLGEGGMDKLFINSTVGSQRANIFNIFEYDTVLTAQQRIDLAQYAAEAWHPTTNTVAYTDGPNATVASDTVTATATVTIS